MKFKILVCGLLYILLAFLVYATYKKGGLDLFTGGMAILIAARILTEFESELKEKRWYRVLMSIATIGFILSFGLYLFGFHGHL